MTDLHRTVKKVVRYTPEEAARLAERAHACGRPVASYVREVSLGASPKARHGHEVAELIRVLAGTANTLVELSRLAASGMAPASERFDQALDEVLEAIRRIE